MSTYPAGFETWPLVKRNKYFADEASKFSRKSAENPIQVETNGRRDSGHPADAAGKAIIKVKPGEQAQQVRETEDALTASVALFQRGNRLVRPGFMPVKYSDHSNGVSPGIHEQKIAGIHGVITETAVFKKWDRRNKHFVDHDPPEILARIIHARAGQWPFPRLAATISCPTLRPDGSLLSAPGFDEKTGFYNFWQGGDLGMSSSPSRFEAEKALSDLSSLLDEFAFVADVDRAVALSCLITPIVRGAIDVCPLHAITAPMPASGKSFLVDIAAMIATGRRCPVQSVTEDKLETEKRLVGAALMGFPIISIDNVNHEIASDLLCQMVERPLIHLRPLGGSPIREIENHFFICATGNGLGVSGDLVRRTFICRLDQKLERPEIREYDSNPLEMVARDRIRYVRSALTIVQAYLLSDAKLDLPPLSSFDGYTNTVRGALVWLGCVDPALSIETSRANDTEAKALRTLIVYLHQVFRSAPFSVHAVIESISRQEDGNSSLWTDEPHLSDKDRAEFREALLSVAGERGAVNGRKLSIWLRKHVDRRVGGFWLQKAAEDKHLKAPQWFIETL